MQNLLHVHFHEKQHTFVRNNCCRLWATRHTYGARYLLVGSGRLSQLWTMSPKRWSDGINCAERLDRCCAIWFSVEDRQCGIWVDNDAWNLIWSAKENVLALLGKSAGNWTKNSQWTYVAIFIQLIVCELELIKRDDLFHPCVSRCRWIWMHMNAWWRYWICFACYNPTGANCYEINCIEDITNEVNNLEWFYLWNE